MKEKSGRNESCPCGSGKKYKKCCLGKEITIPRELLDEDAMGAYQEMLDNRDKKNDPPPTFMEYMGKPNLATDSLRDISKMAQGQEFESEEDLKAFVNEQMSMKNDAPLYDFLGLSPSQMHSVINRNIDDNKNILEINSILPADSVNDVPAVKQCYYLLGRVGEADKGIKATDKGNFPRALIQEFYITFIKEHDLLDRKPMSEDDVIEVQKAKYFLRDSGFIKYKNRWYSLTAKGRKMLHDFDAVSFYICLFRYFAESFNWLYGTRYAEAMGFVQQSYIFCLYLIKSKANEYISGEELAKTYLDAFPSLVSDEDSEYRKIMALSGFVYLFLEGFSCYLGLVDMKRGGDVLSIRETRFKTKKLFDELISWKV